MASKKYGLPLFVVNRQGDKEEKLVRRNGKEHEMYVVNESQL